jgi:hypothetical protein
MPATTINSSQMQLLATDKPATRASKLSLTIRTLQHTGHAHPVFVPANLGNSGAVTDRLPATGLEARLLPGMSGMIVGPNLGCRPSLSAVSGFDWSGGSPLLFRGRVNEPVSKT